MPTTSRSPFNRSFGLKVACTALLIGLAQWLFYGEQAAATLGGYIFVWCGALAVAVPCLRRGAAAALLAVAAVLALLLVEDASLLGWALCWTALASAALLTRRSFDDMASWAVRLFTLGAIGIVTPTRDAVRLLKRQSTNNVSIVSVGAVLVLPLVGATLFLTLFAAANPLIASALEAIRLPSIWDITLHLLFWSVVLTIVWPTFRPRAARLDGGLVRDQTSPFDLPVPTVLLSLAAFNAVFAVQNVLDLTFLWSGAALPTGVTLAEYAHQGAYTLIATAILAGAFVLIALAPGSSAARNQTVRQLIVLWMAQNLLLVASSILRLLDYIAAYSLTELRIAALAWMGLVAVGLALIAWRLFFARSAAWLINANALAAALMLVAADVVDLGAVAARWNVDHARRANQLDLCYIARLGPSALLPLIDLEHRAAGPNLRDRSRYLRRGILTELEAAQADWHQWTWRGARRLAAARALVGSDREPVRAAPDGRGCDGSIEVPPPPIEPTATPAKSAAGLTNGMQR